MRPQSVLSATEGGYGDASRLNGHLRFDCGRALIIVQNKIRHSEIINGGLATIGNGEGGQRQRLSFELLFNLVNGVEIDVRVAYGMNEFADLELTKKGHHMQ